MTDEPPLVIAADVMRKMLQKRLEALAGAIEGSPEEAELVEIAEAVFAYDAEREAAYAKQSSPKSSIAGPESAA